MKGSYLLLIESPEEQAVSVGSLKLVRFTWRYCAYVGSALNGIEARLNRHLRKEKKLHWHIDYLLQTASIRSIIFCETEERAECRIAQALGLQFSSLRGFGSSDCKCVSHLFCANGPMETEVTRVVTSLGLNPTVMTENLLRDRIVEWRQSS